MSMHATANRSRSASRLERTPDESLVLDIQNALWGSGLVRAVGAVGAVNILIAGYAIVNGATVLTADRDFDYIARVSELKHEYVAPSADATGEAALMPHAERRDRVES